MARDPRFVPPGSLVEVSCRYIQGRSFLRPGKLLNALLLGVLVMALQGTGISVHAVSVLSNHWLCAAAHIALAPAAYRALDRRSGAGYALLSGQCFEGSRPLASLAWPAPGESLQGSRLSTTTRPARWPNSATCSPQVVKEGLVWSAGIGRVCRGGSFERLLKPTETFLVPVR